MSAWTSRVPHVALFVLETVTVVLLGVLVTSAIAALVLETLSLVRPPFLGGEQVGHVLDHILAVFVLIELLATAVAYIRGGDMLRRLFEAALVAIVRKLITLDFSEAAFAKGVMVGCCSDVLRRRGGSFVARGSEQQMWAIKTTTLACENFMLALAAGGTTAVRSRGSTNPRSNVSSR